MTDRCITFSLSDYYVDVVSSTVHLEGDSLAERLEQANYPVLKTGKADIKLTYLSIPKHLIEQLWLTGIPQITGKLQQNKAGSTSGLEALGLLVVTADNRFDAIETIETIETMIIHVSPDGQDNTKLNISKIIETALPMQEEPETCMMGWLNLDEYPHHIHVTARTKSSKQNHLEEADNDQVILTIRPNEALVWRGGNVQVSELASGAGNSVKLLLRGRQKRGSETEEQNMTV